MELKDFTSECMLEWAGSVDELRNSFCRACAQKECQHSFAASTATAKRVRKNEEMMQFRPPTEDGRSLPVISSEVSEAPVVEMPTVKVPEELQTEQRGDVTVQMLPPPQEVSPADLGGISDSLAAVRAAHAAAQPQVVEMDKPPPASTPAPPQAPSTPVLTPSRHTETYDPWAVAASDQRTLDYTEKDAKADPWSVTYEGGRTIKGRPGQKIVLSGGKNGD